MAVVKWFGDKVFKDTKKDMEGRVREGLSIIANAARADCPEGKGDLKNSIEEIYFSRARSPQGIVKATGSEKDGYASHVDLGHKTKDGTRVRPDPFMRNALKKNKNKLKRTLGIS